MKRMECPNCKQEMKDKSYWYYGLGSWDMDYPDCLHEEHFCKTCKISYLNGEWNIPKNIIATEKQIKTASFISNVLQCEMPIHTKKLLWKFINENLQTAIKVKEQNFEDWCWDNANWLPEYF